MDARLSARSMMKGRRDSEIPIGEAYTTSVMDLNLRMGMRLSQGQTKLDSLLLDFFRIPDAIRSTFGSSLYSALNFVTGHSLTLFLENRCGKKAKTNVSKLLDWVQGKHANVSPRDTETIPLPEFNNLYQVLVTLSNPPSLTQSIAGILLRVGLESDGRTG
jgi:hypothetical protein